MKSYPSLFGVLCLSHIICAPVAASAADVQTFDVKAGEELTFAVTVADDHLAFSSPRRSKFGLAQTGKGEITIGRSPRDKSLYERIVVVEKTPRPVDFVATGFVGGTKIDEAVLCGRLDAPSESRIGAVSWRVSLNQFELRKEGVPCQ